MQVALNRAYTETLNSASDVLSTTMEEHCSLMKEVCLISNFYIIYYCWQNTHTHTQYVTIPQSEQTFLEI